MMVKHIFDKNGTKLLRTEIAEPECGKDFCDNCGDCLACDSNYCQDCSWVVYEENEEPNVQG
jgi:hypothetical protein